MKKLFIGALVGLFLSGTAYAAQESTTMTLSVTVGDSCNVASTPVDFAGYDGTAAANATGSIQVTCTSGVTYNIALDGGQNLGSDTGSPSNRALSDGASTFLAYVLNNPTDTLEWGDSDYAATYVSGSSVSGTGTGSPVDHTVNGQLLSQGAAVASGAYSDTVNVTVHF